MPTSAAVTHHFHAVVWIDHREARVFHFNFAELEKATIRPDHPASHLHHKAGCIGAGHAAEDLHYFRAVAEAVEEAGAILIVGPSNAKHELVKYLLSHAPDLAGHVVGVEASDHPSDGQIVARARAYFHATDRMTAQRG